MEVTRRPRWSRPRNEGCIMRVRCHLANFAVQLTGGRVRLLQSLNSQIKAIPPDVVPHVLLAERLPSS